MPEDVSGSDQFLEEETTTLPDESSEELPAEPESQEEDLEEESLEESTDVSGNDLSGYQDDGSLTDLQADPAQVEALVEVCTKINQDIVNGFTAVCILLGVLIGIVFVKGFSTFIKGV